MANAKRDENRTPTIQGVSNADGSTPLTPYVDSTTNRLLTNATVTGTVSQKQPSTPTVTTVGDATSSTQLLASNANRIEAEFINNSSAVLYILKGSGTASSSNYTVSLNQGDYYITNYTGQINGIWASDAGGSVLITEST